VLGAGAERIKLRTLPVGGAKVSKSAEGAPGWFSLSRLKKFGVG
jgi:hypothetical protein